MDVIKNLKNLDYVFWILKWVYKKQVKMSKPHEKIKYCQRRRLMMRNSEEKDSACTSDMIDTKHSDDDEIVKEVVTKNNR